MVYGSAQGPAARRHTTKELACPLGGALDPGPVVRVFLKSVESNVPSLNAGVYLNLLMLL